MTVPVQIESNARLLSFLSAMTRTAIAQRLGSQYDGRRDIYKVAGYPVSLTYDQHWNLYTRQDIAGRIVDMQPQTTWRTPPEIVEIGKEEESTAFTKDVSSLVRRLGLWAKFERVDRLAGIGRYAIMVIGARGGAGEDAELKTPLPPLRTVDDVLYLSCYPEKFAEINAWETDTSNPRFGLPKLYKIKFATENKGFDRAAEGIVHWSRIIHVAENAVLDDVHGLPRLERVYNRLQDLEKILAATGEAFWQLAGRILTGKVEPGAEFPEAERKKVLEQLEEIIHDLRRTFIGQDIGLEWLESTPPDPEKAARVLFSLIAGAVGIPMRMLFGSETGERASSQDQLAYFGTINERQERHAEPNILRPFLDRLIDHGALPKPGDEGYNVIWPSLHEESDKDKASANKDRAETARALTPVGGDPLDIVEIDQDRNVWLLPKVAGEMIRPPIMPEGEGIPTPPEGGDEE